MSTTSAWTPEAAPGAATRSHCTQAMEIVYRCAETPLPAENSRSFYASFFRESGITTKQKKPNGREWDYFQEGGVSHYGLLPEFLHEVVGLLEHDAHLHAREEHLAEPAVVAGSHRARAARGGGRRGGAAPPRTPCRGGRANPDRRCPRVP